MKNMRIPLLSAICVAILALIIGSFVDYQLSSAIASSTNGFGLFISVIAPTIGFCAFAFIGGGFFALGLKQQKLWVKIVFIALAIVAFGVTVNYAGKEYFGINGFADKAPMFVGYLTAGICGLAAEIGGYFTFKDCKNDKAWIPFLCVYIVLFLVLICGITGLKSLMHRPRYRTVLDQSIVPFHNWWQRCANYKDYIALGISKEEFKSFPSGHTGEAAILIVVSMFAPMADDRLKKAQLPMFIGSCCFVILVGFSRILAAAHYLSDVSMGALITLVFACIANEVLIKFIKPTKIEEKIEEAEKVEEVKE